MKAVVAGIVVLVLAYAIFSLVKARHSDIRIVRTRQANVGDRAVAWDWEMDWEVTGKHIPGGFGQNCGDVKRQVTSGPGHIEADTKVLYQDHDTQWSFNRVNDRFVQWNACANNCTFSCDTIKLHLMSRTVVP